MSEILTIGLMIFGVMFGLTKLHGMVDEKITYMKTMLFFATAFVLAGMLFFAIAIAQTTYGVNSDYVKDLNGPLVIMMAVLVWSVISYFIEWFLFVWFYARDLFGQWAKRKKA